MQNCFNIVAIFCFLLYFVVTPHCFAQQRQYDVIRREIWTDSPYADSTYRLSERDFPLKFSQHFIKNKRIRDVVVEGSETEFYKAAINTSKPNAGGSTTMLKPTIHGTKDLKYNYIYLYNKQGLLEKAICKTSYPNFPSLTNAFFIHNQYDKGHRLVFQNKHVACDNCALSSETALEGRVYWQKKYFKYKGKELKSIMTQSLFPKDNTNVTITDTLDVSGKHFYTRTELTTFYYNSIHKLRSSVTLASLNDSLSRSKNVLNTCSWYTYFPNGKMRRKIVATKFTKSLDSSYDSDEYFWQVKTEENTSPSGKEKYFTRCNFKINHPIDTLALQQKDFFLTDNNIFFCDTVIEEKPSRKETIRYSYTWKTTSHKDGRTKITEIKGVSGNQATSIESMKHPDTFSEVFICRSSRSVKENQHDVGVVLHYDNGKGIIKLFYVKADSLVDYGGATLIAEDDKRQKARQNRLVERIGLLAEKSYSGDAFLAELIVGTFTIQVHKRHDARNN